MSPLTRSLFGFHASGFLCPASLFSDFSSCATESPRSRTVGLLREMLCESSLLQPPAPDGLVQALLGQPKTLSRPQAVCPGFPGWLCCRGTRRGQGSGLTRGPSVGARENVGFARTVGPALSVCPQKDVFGTFPPPLPQPCPTDFPCPPCTGTRLTPLLGQASSECSLSGWVWM